MRAYRNLVQHVLSYGIDTGDRTGVGTLDSFGARAEFDLRDGFPLLTLKETNFKAIVAELLWFLSGSTNNNDLNALGTKIWDPWATETGDLGPIYGKQWTQWDAIDRDRVTDTLESLLEDSDLELKESKLNRIKDLLDYLKNDTHINQIENLIDDIIQHPTSRRLVVSAWNPSDVPIEDLTPQVNVEIGNASLASCHALFQVHTRALTYEERLKEFRDLTKFPVGQIDSNDKEALTKKMNEFKIPIRGISCQLYQRSADLGLGVPFNIASYALLLHLIGRSVNMTPLKLIWVGGSTHIYKNQIEGLKEMLKRKEYPLPKLKINTKNRDIFSYSVEDIAVIDYQCHPRISFKAAV